MSRRWPIGCCSWICVLYSLCLAAACTIVLSVGLSEGASGLFWCQGPILFTLGYVCVFSWCAAQAEWCGLKHGSFEA